MKIKFEKEAVLIAELDKQKLEDDLKQTMNFEESIKKNLNIKNNKTEEQNIDELKEFVWLGTDWYDLIMNFNYYSQQKLRIEVYPISITDFTQYSPHLVTEEGELEYKSTKKDLLDDYLFILVDVNNPDNLNKSIERMLCTRIINYVGNKWKQLWIQN